MDPRRVNRFDYVRHGFAVVHATVVTMLAFMDYYRHRDLWIAVLATLMIFCTLFFVGMYNLDMLRQRRENEQLIAEIEAATKMDPRGINQFDYTTFWVTVGFYCFIIGSTVAFVIRGASTWTFSFWIVYAAVAMVVWYDQAKRDWEEQVARNEELIRSIEAAITKV